MPPALTVDVPAEVTAEVVATRRDLHQHPELGFEEHRTAALVADRLRALGFEVHTGIGQTGVVGVVHGAAPGKTIMLRADMDGLPIDEENVVPYRSESAVHMHACGHDGHVAMLLGAARVVMSRRDEIAGTVCFLFQPAEEGKGGHGASPHLSIDPIYVAAQFVVAVQQIVSRQIDPIEPAVVTIGAIHGGTTHNVIPSRVQLLGTVRAFDAGVRAKMSERIERVLRGVCESSGASY